MNAYAQVKRYEENLLSWERTLLYVRASQAMVETDGWKALEESLRAEERDLIEKFVQSESCDPAIIQGLRTGIRVLRRQIELPHLKAKQIADAEAAVKRLRAKIEYYRTEGLGISPTEVEEAHSEVNQLLGAPL